jgi:hypothetical protein
MNPGLCMMYIYVDWVEHIQTLKMHVLFFKHLLGLLVRRKGCYAEKEIGDSRKKKRILGETKY